MKTAVNHFLYPVFILFFIAANLSAQANTTQTGALLLNGVPYKIISPTDFSSYTDAGQTKLGERYVIDDSVLGVNGTRLTLMNTGVMNTFILSQPTVLDSRAKVRVYIEITKVFSLAGNFVEGRIDKLEGPSSQIVPSNSVRNLDGLDYKIYTPQEFDFYSDAGQMKPDERYVIEDSVLGINGTRLTLMNTGVMNSFILSQPTALDTMAKVRLYVEITKVNTTVANYVEAKIVKLEKL